MNVVASQLLDPSFREGVPRHCGRDTLPGPIAAVCVPADDPVELTAEIRKQLESARVATQGLFERLAGWD